MKKYLILFPLLYSLALAQSPQTDNSLSIALAQSRSIQLGAQSSPRQHTVYADFGVIAYPYRSAGQGLWTLGGAIGTINYERELYQTSDGRFSARVRTGIGSMLFSHFGIPLAFTGLLGRNQHHFEANLGAYLGIFETFGRLFDETNPYRFHSFNPLLWPIIEAGYRYQRPEGGLLFRAKLGTAGIGLGLGWVF